MRAIRGRDENNYLVMIRPVECGVVDDVCGSCFYSFRKSCAGVKCLPYERKDKQKVFFRRKGDE